MTEKQNIQRMDSKASIGFPDVSKDSDKKQKSIGNQKSNGKQKSNEDLKNQKTDEIKEKEELATDICQLLVFCQIHQKICITRISSKGLCLPSIPIRSTDSWTSKGNQLMAKIGIKCEAFETFDMINVFRLQMTQTSNFITRLTFLVSIPKDTKCCSDYKQFKWLSINQMIEKNDWDFFWGPEIHLWTRFWIKNQSMKDVKHRNEFDTRDALRDYCDRPSVCTTTEQLMIRSACFAEKDILKVYDLFIQHCYPSQYMTFSSFKIFIKKIGLKLNENVLIPTFRAFDYRRRLYLTFNELLLGLAAMDQATEHGGESGKIRCAYLMRFYDSDSDGFLTQSDICQMIVDIQKLPNSPHKNTYNTKKSSVDEYAKQIIKNHGTNDKISLIELTQAIGSLKYRGTSGLFRAPGPTIKHSVKISTDDKSNCLSVGLVKNNKYESCCETCRQRSYKISSNLFIMNTSGEVLSFNDLRDKSIDFFSEFEDKEIFDLAADLINKLHQINRYRFHSNPNEQKPEDISNWFYPSKQILIKKLLSLCEKSKLVFEKEDRVLKISTPCYIFGDIHGNFKDLMIFANNFWRKSPLLSDCNYLFLGDYVDRGNYGVECVIYLFALKLIAPKNFWLCRGNHEIRSLQEAFTFLSECVDNYSDSVWTAINEVFDRLPISAVIDNKIFCSHGGIPTSDIDIKKLERAPHKLPDPQNEWPEAWEVLWNDPLSDDDFRQLTAFERKEVENSNGFLQNTKRGTAYYYSEQAVHRFLEHNDMQFVIRGHECVINGYKFLMNGRVMTIFSTSHYCNLKNEASIVFVNQNKIRVIRVHTFD